MSGRDTSRFALRTMISLEPGSFDGTEGGSSQVKYCDGLMTVHFKWHPKDIAIEIFTLDARDEVQLSGYTQLLVAKKICEEISSRGLGSDNLIRVAKDMAKIFNDSIFAGKL